MYIFTFFKVRNIFKITIKSSTQICRSMDRQTKSVVQTIYNLPGTYTCVFSYDATGTFGGLFMCSLAGLSMGNNNYSNISSGSWFLDQKPGYGLSLKYVHCIYVIGQLPASGLPGVQDYQDYY